MRIDLKNLFCLSGDIIILGSSFQDHFKNIEEIFRKLKTARLKLGPKKCAFFQKEVRYLGHTISSEGGKNDPEKTGTISKWSVLRAKHELRRFLGFCTYYRRFVKNFADTAEPVHRLTENTCSFEWSK